MLSLSRLRLSVVGARSVPKASLRSYSTSDPVPANQSKSQQQESVQNVSETNAVPVTAAGAKDAPLQEQVDKAEERRVMQAPNREGIWSRSQAPRSKAMTGPRFEQTMMEYQPRPQAAISLIHKQPVRWTKSRVVECDGGGGPLGHPRIFINVDKPQINMCTYCGLPFAHEHHRKHLESLPSTSYPLVPEGDAAEVEVSQRITDKGLEQR
ncbi:MAG: hypothetical protein M1825_001673 [Sarcosagium campestre]|nr:MAG: hypothetical protein M1825_001673 [Sarcosagium campestre]